MKRAAPLAFALLAGCVVGPKYRAPVTPAPAAGGFVEASAAPSTTTAAQPEGAWWRLYQDPVLDGLIADALAANTDLRQSAANLEIARGALRQARSARLPTTDLANQYSFGRRSVFGSPGSGFISGGADTSFFNNSFGISYELDLFGRVRRLIQAARRDYEAERALLDVTRVAVAADTARSYADACAAAEQRAVAERTVALLGRSLTITSRTLEAGRGTRLDVERARALVEQQRARIPAFQAQQAAALYALATLTGRTPAELPSTARACSATPRLRQPVPIGDGAALLRRRPDIRSAERRLAADTARIGVETASLYPTISLGASIGAQALSFTRLFNNNALNYSVGPLLSFSFPNQEVARGRIAQARGQATASLAAFDGTVLTALQETETAISALARELDRRQALARAREAAAQSARLSRLRFSEGYDGFLTVIDADRTLAETEATLAQSDAAIADNQIQLFRALGGGWEGLPEPAQAINFDGSANGRTRAAAIQPPLAR